MHQTTTLHLTINDLEQASAVVVGDSYAGITFGTGGLMIHGRDAVPCEWAQALRLLAQKVWAAAVDHEVDYDHADRRREAAEAAAEDHLARTEAGFR